MKKLQNIVLFIAVILFGWFSIDVLNQTQWFGDHIDFEKGSQYGGLIAGVFSFLSVILIYLTLRHQASSYEKSAFENRFFQLIDYHRKNVEIIEYRDPSSKMNSIIKGQKVFVNIHREIIKAIKILKNELKIENVKQLLNEEEISKLKNNPRLKDIDILELEIINLAYLIVFFGVSKEGRPVLERILKERSETNKIKNILDYFEKIPTEWDKEENKDKYPSRKVNNYHYKYFGGHQHRLGHYYRHIFQTVNYVDDFKPFIGDYETKYNYLKNYRAQFSTYEQAVFAYNSLSVIGRIWEINVDNENKRLITKYNLIKNIPAEFISEFDLKNYYPNVEYEGFNKSEKKIELIKKYK